MNSPTQSPVHMNPGKFGLAEHRRATYVAIVPRGTTKETIEDPTFWAHVSAKIRPWSHIEVQAEDGTFYAELLVLACDRTWARVKLLCFHNLTSSDISQTQAAQINKDYEIKHRGSKRWSVVRRSDNALLQEGLLSEEDASKWLAVHLNTLGVAT